MQETMPQEIEVRYILPAIRRELARIFIQDHKLSQKDAAKTLGLTEAAVSNYMKDRRAAEVQLNDHIKSLIKESVENILGKNSDVFTEIYKIVSECEKDLTVCQIHMIYDEVPQGCAVCFESKTLKPGLIQLKNLIKE